MRVVDVGDPADVTDDVTQVWGDLIGYWWTTTFDLGVATKSGVVTGSGTERFDGCLDANGNGCATAPIRRDRCTPRSRTPASSIP